jgi:tetratricopeptide (TPR) repeat protein
MNIKIVSVSLIIIFVVIGCSPKVATKKEAEPLPDFDKLWDYNNPGASEMKFRGLLPRAKESGDISYYTQLLTQIARTQGLQRKFRDAHKTLDTVEGMLTDELIVARVRYLLERGRTFNSSGYKDKAKPLFLQAYKTAAVNHLDFYAIDAIHMLQIVEPPEKQLEWAEKALGMAEASTDERAKKWLGALYNNTGWTYFDLEQYDAALKLFEKSLKWREEQSDEHGMIIAKWTIARTYRETGKVEEALVMQKDVETTIQKKGLEPDGYVFEEIGECLLLLNKKDEAQPYFKKAYDILSKDEWIKANEPEHLKRLKELSE